MNTLFVVKGCSHCLAAKEAVLFANLQLTPPDKISMIDVDGGDPRISALAEIYDTWDRKQWSVPVLVLQDEAVRQKFEGFEKSTGGKIVVVGTLVFDNEHYHELVSNIKSGKSWR